MQARHSVHIAKRQHGPPRGLRSRCGPWFAQNCGFASWCVCGQCAATSVWLLSVSFSLRQNEPENRLNTHLSTLVMVGARSTPFRTPVESGGRKTQPRATSLSLGCLTCRISSFGFSGTIAHGLFSLNCVLYHRKPHLLSPFSFF